MSIHAMFDVPRALRETRANGEGPSYFSAELERLLFKGLRVADRQEVRALFEAEIFRPRQCLTSEEAVALGYRRARFLAARLQLRAAELRDDPRRLYALHDWTPLICGIASTVTATHYCLALRAVMVHGEGRPELDGFIAELERMDSVGVFLATELGYGGDVAALETEAVYDAHLREFSLSSPTGESSKFTSHTASAVPKLAIVMARLISQHQDRGIFPFVVRLRGEDGFPCPGISTAPLTETLGGALENGSTAFDRVRVPKDQLLIGKGSVLHDDGRFESLIPSHRRSSWAAMAEIQTGRVCFTGMAAALMRAATFISVRITSQRLASAPGKPSVQFLACRKVQRDVFGGLGKAYAVTFAVRFLQARFRLGAAEFEPEVFRLTAALKAVVTAEVSEALPRLRERCSPLSTVAADRILDFWQQIQGFVTTEGDHQLMLFKAGRELLDSTESSLPVLPGAAVSVALDPQEAVFLFGYREARLKQELKDSSSDGGRRTGEPMVVGNDNVDRTLALANAYGTRLLAECFRVAIADCGDEAGARVLRTLFSLWAAGHVERHAGWFLSQGCITREAVEHLQSDCDRLCAGIEPHVPELVNAFGFDDILLRAPIAEDDYRAANDSPLAAEHKSGAFPIEGARAAEVREA
jgi:acyl-CoA oxidase